MFSNRTIFCVIGSLVSLVVVELFDLSEELFSKVLLEFSDEILSLTAIELSKDVSLSSDA